ncbi:hypothetical protein GQ44DRAFT_701047 [Phaeosphaeriaceae sp. PMI808]|nr:hypothetical protein GQ44DRAFT_701047 [Phaeosphaeriaceae sp. PMI808]
MRIDLQDFQCTEIPTLVIRDLAQSVEHANRLYIKDKDVRFYAGAPLISPAGAIIGTVSVFDDRPRPDGLSNEHQRSLHDISESIMDYLHNYTIKDQLWRGERFTRGLLSFSEGASALLPFENNAQKDPDNAHIYRQPSSALSSPYETNGEYFGLRQQPFVPLEPAALKSPRNRQQLIRRLQEAILPTDARSMFARAANVLLASSDLDGVIILDASIATTKNHQRRESHGDRSTGTTSGFASSSSDDGNTNRTKRTRVSTSRTCQVLGAATVDISGHNKSSTTSPQQILLEKDLVRMLHDYKDGKIMTFGLDGLPLSSTDESGSPLMASSGSSRDTPKNKSTRSRTRKNFDAVRVMLPVARSVAFVPFWDYERSRWFAGCLCWSNRSHRLLSPTTDIPYLTLFSHSIMRELSRLDALALNQLKTTFVASISHELRSPLHGILGTLEFIKDTPLDSFQTSMINSLNACGQTLLDTINHVMEYAKIGESMRNISSQRLHSTHTVRLSSKPLKGQRPKADSFDLSIATEEVVEAVFSGSSYVPIFDVNRNPPSLESDSDTKPMAKRKTCYVVLDIAPDNDWLYCFPVGPWRRIVMNIFGNALKYTQTGYIQVNLRVNDGSSAMGALRTIILTITDSGMGMSPQFLANKAFHPFSQEDSFATGTGLGLSIVRQIIETNGGKIEINSEPSIGTKLTVKLALRKPENPANTPLPNMTSQLGQHLSALQRLEGRTIRILHRNRFDAEEGLKRFTNSLANTLEKHLKMHIVRSTSWEEHEDDIVIVPELDFDYLDSIRRARVKYARAPVTVFIAMDALEAATLRADVRVQNTESVVEIMMQPCGPQKLAYILNGCLKRFALPEENLKHDTSDGDSSHHSIYSKPQSPPPPPESIRDTELSFAIPRQDPVAIDVASSAAANPSGQKISAPIQPFSNITEVLIVDDNPINRKILEAFMKRIQFSYQEAKNGLEALEMYKIGASHIKIILMDISMPIMDGMTSTRAIREHEDLNNIPRCYIIALTGLTSASARLSALSSGVDYFMTKPLDFKLLGSLLKGINEKKTEHLEMQVVKERGNQDKPRKHQEKVEKDRGKAKDDREKTQELIHKQDEDKSPDLQRKIGSGKSARGQRNEMGDSTLPLL